MDRVSLYLRTPLFSYGGSDHLPDGVYIVEGQMAAAEDAYVRIDADRLLDERGRELTDEVTTLMIPWAKIDHVLVIA